MTAKDLSEVLRKYRLETDNRARNMIAYNLSHALHHLPLRQGQSVECARCGASGTVTEVLSGPVHLTECEVRS